MSRYILDHCFDAEIRRPFRLVYSIGASPNTVSQVHFTCRELKHWLGTLDIHAQVLAGYRVKVTFTEHAVTTVFLEHINIGWNQDTHRVEVTENLSSIHGPQRLPYIVGVDADRLDQPLRVVVQCHLHDIGATTLTSSEQGVQDTS